MQREIKSTEEMHTLACEFVSGLQPGEIACVVLLHGDLGSGKTTFTQGVAQCLGVRETITSPTFVILKNYELSGKTFHTLVHIDAYRLQSAQELVALGWEEILQDSGNLIVIEWPEQVKGALPDDAHRIDFEFVDETTRRVTIE